MLPSASALLVFCSSLVIWTVLEAANGIQYTDAGGALEETSTAHRLVKRKITKDIRGFSQEDKDAILERHNKLRRDKGAKNMMKLVWDPNLEKLAQKYSENCTFVHSKYPSGTAGYNYIGENLYVSGGTIIPPNVVQSWYNEIVDYDFSALKCAPNKVCGHYTQVVWSTTRGVGCGVKFCATVYKLRFGNAYNVVCNYGPGGNVVGRPPFLKGDPCAECPKDAVHCVTDLCSLTAESGPAIYLIQDTRSHSGLLFLSTVGLRLLLSILAL